MKKSRNKSLTPSRDENASSQEPTRILFSSDGPGLNAKISDRLGTAPYFLIVNRNTLDIKAVSNPGAAGGRGGGSQAVIRAVENRVQMVVTGYCSPPVAQMLSAQGIQVVQNARGTVSEWIQRFQATPEIRPSETDRVMWQAALSLSARQFAGILPLILGVIGLIGLLNVFVPRHLLRAIFSERNGWNTVLGAALGSVLAGNSINSYIIGGSLLRSGVGLAAVTAFMVAWVSVGLIQLPVEAGTLGRRFAVLRNVLSFLMAIGIAYLIPLFMGWPR